MPEGVSPIHAVPGVSDPVEIGDGGFGRVYRAEQTDLGREVAVKVLKFQPDDATLSRFRREARALGSLSAHPNIVALHEAAVTDDGFPYMIMEYASGGSLQGQLDTGGPLDWRRAFEVAVGVCAGLEEAHRRGMVHRDIKPDNIFWSDHGVPLVGDFGIASLTDATRSKTGNVSGTLAHASPEQLSGMQVDHRSDVYSLGSTLYHLIDGQPAFLRPGQPEMLPAVIGRIASTEPAPISNIPVEAMAVIDRAMVKIPDERTPDITTLAAELRHALEQPGAAQPTPSRVSTHTLVDAPPAAASDSRAPATGHFVPPTPDVEVQHRPETTDDPPSSSQRLVLGAVLAALVLAVGAAVSFAVFRSQDAGNEIDVALDGSGNGLDPPATAPPSPTEAAASEDLTGGGGVGLAAANDETPEVAYRGHRGRAFSVIALSDGRIASGGIGEVLVWEPDNPTGSPVIYRGHTDEVNDLAELSDGRIASASSDGTVQIWDPDDVEKTAATHFSDDPQGVSAVVELSDGTIASAGDDNTVSLWRPDQPEVVLATYTGHGNRVEALIELSDGSIASVGASGVQIWNPADPAITLATYDEHTWSVSSVVELPDGTMVSASSGGMVHLWDRRDPSVTIAEYTGHDDWVHELALLGNGTVASASSDNTVQVWDPADPAITLATYRGHDEAVRALAVLGNGAIASASRDRTVQIWDPEAPGVTLATFTGHTDRVYALIELANGSVATVSFADPTVRVWDPDDPGVTLDTYLGHDDSVVEVIELSDGTVASASRDNTVHVWDPEDPRITLAAYSGHTESVLAVAELPDGRIASGGRDGAVHVWDPANPGVADAVYDDLEGYVVNLLVLSSGRLAIVDFGPHHVHVWDPSSPDERSAPFTGHSSNVVDMIELSDGTIATASFDATVQIWNPDNPEITLTAFTGHTDSVRGLVQLRSGVIASASEDGTVQIWDPADADITLATFIGHTGEVLRVIQLSDGSLASAGDEVLLWDPANVSAEAVVLHRRGVFEIAELSDNRIAASAIGALVLDIPDA